MLKDSRSGIYGASVAKSAAIFSFFEKFLKVEVHLKLNLFQSKQINQDAKHHISIK